MSSSRLRSTFSTSSSWAMGSLLGELLGASGELLVSGAGALCFASVIIGEVDEDEGEDEDEVTSAPSSQPSTKPSASPVASCGASGSLCRKKNECCSNKCKKEKESKLKKCR